LCAQERMRNLTHLNPTHSETDMTGLRSDRMHKSLNRHLDRLYEEWERVYDQMGRTWDERQLLLLERQAEALERRIKGFEEKVGPCEVGSSPQAARRRYLHWERYIPEINFTEVLRLIEDVFRRFEGTPGGAALFLLQNAHSMGGRWCVERVRRLLSEKTADFKHYEIGLSPGDRLDAWTLLRRLGEYVGSELPPVDQDAEYDELAIRNYARVIGQKIVGSLQSGSVVFVELRTWDASSLQSYFLPWFVQDFWASLVRQLSLVVHKHPLVNFIGMIVVETPIPEGGLAVDLCCTQEQFSGEKALPLPLRLWTLEEIRRWLFSFSGLTAPSIGVEAQAIERMAQNIHEASGGGQPELVYTALMTTLEHYFKSFREESV